MNRELGLGKPRDDYFDPGNPDKPSVQNTPRFFDAETVCPPRAIGVGEAEPSDSLSLGRL
jgi:hypothetical protein